MYINNNILVGKNNDNEAYILTNMANRHGLITGASGTGKTITLKVIAESFSDAGVPVFLADVKGDIAGMCVKGNTNEKIESRLKDLNIDNFEFKDFPVHFFDVYGLSGHPIRTTIKNIGYQLLSRMLGLTDAQEGVLAIIFKIAEEENWELIDLKDLKALLTYVGEKRKDYTLKYGNVTLQSIGAIQRNLLVLESDGGDLFFGEPAMDIKDFIKFSPTDGRGFINILDAQTLFQKPNLYATFLLWILNELYKTMPEVGDLAKPKFVLFLDEAHLLFEEMPDYMVKNIIQIVKLIRSKGIGLFFISQSPKDIPDEVLNQLGNRIQHALRAYTPMEEKTIKAAAQSFRVNEKFNTEEAIRNLGTGEALISFLNEKGEPNIVDKFTILPPESAMGTIDNTIRLNVMNNSMLKGKYDTRLENISAYELVEQELEKEQLEKKKIEEEKQKEKELKAKSKAPKSKTEKAVDKVTNSAMSSIGRQIGNKIIKGLFK